MKTLLTLSVGALMSLLSCGLTQPNDALPEQGTGQTPNNQSDAGSVIQSDAGSVSECVAPASRGSCSTPYYWSAVLTAVECKNGATFPFVLGAHVQLRPIQEGPKVYCGWQIPSLGEVDWSSAGLFGNLNGLGACCGHVLTSTPTVDLRDAGAGHVYAAEALVMTCADCSFTFSTGQ